MVDIVAAEGVAISAMITVNCVGKQEPENYIVAWNSKRRYLITLVH